MKLDEILQQMIARFLDFPVPKSLLDEVIPTTREQLALWVEEEIFKELEYNEFNKGYNYCRKQIADKVRGEK